MRIKTKRILFIAPMTDFDPLGRSQIIPYLMGLTQLQNFKITIISFEKIHDKIEFEKTKELLDSKNIDWTPLVYTKTTHFVYDLGYL